MPSRGGAHRPERRDRADGADRSRRLGRPDDDLEPGHFTYRVRFAFPDGNTWEREDPYRFGPTLGEVDLHLISEGTHERLYDVLGAHPRTHQGVAA